MTTSTQKPVFTIRDGALKAAVWLNKRDSGHYYSVTVSRTFKQGDKFKDSYSFSGTENLRAAELHRKAYNRLLELRGQDRAPREDGSIQVH